MSKPNLSGQAALPDTSRLDNIYKQLKNLQQFKDEIMGDLEDFDEDFETQSVA